MLDGWIAGDGATLEDQRAALAQMVKRIKLYAASGEAASAIGSRSGRARLKNWSGAPAKTGTNHFSEAAGHGSCDVGTAARDHGAAANRRCDRRTRTQLRMNYQEVAERTGTARRAGGRILIDASLP